MTIHRNSVSLMQLGGTGFMYWVVKTLLTAGCTVRSSGSGTGGTYEASGNVFDMDESPMVDTNGHPGVGNASGTEVWGFPAMWIVIQLHSGEELCINRSALALNTLQDAKWHVDYSRGDGFTAGAANASTPPDATDEESISSTGSKAAPGSIHVTSNRPSIVHIAYDDVAGNAAGKRGLLAVEVYNDKVTPNLLKSWLMIDDLREIATGDTEGCTLKHSSLVWTANNVLGAAFTDCWVDFGGAGEVFGIPRYYGWESVIKELHWVGGTSSYDSNDRSIQLIVARPTLGGYMGLSRWIAQPTVARGYPNTCENNTILFMGDFAIRDLLDGTVVPEGI